MGTVRFNLRTDKASADGLCPIELIYQVSGQRKYINTGIKSLPKYWHSKSQQSIFLDKKALKNADPAIPVKLVLMQSEVIEINASLADWETRISKIEKRFEMDSIPYSSSMVIDELKKGIGPVTKKDESNNFLFDFIDRYISEHTATREPGSLSVYKSLKRHLEDFQKHTGKKVMFTSIDYSFFQAFQNFLISVKGMSNTTVAKQLSTVKTFLSYARKQGIQISDKYKDFRIKKENLEVIALTSSEFETLFAMDLSKNKKLSQVRDIFCFACATGLRYSDLAQLRREHIKGDEIRLTVKKTKESLSVPLNKYSSAILEKYSDQLQPLPMISNQKLNAYLKGFSITDKEKGITKYYPGLCEMAGITEAIEIVRFKGSKRESKIVPKFKLIGVHCGRKTFASLSLEKGMSAEEVMTCTGHKDYKSFKRYVKITEERKRVVMKAAWGSVAENKLKAV